MVQCTCAALWHSVYRCNSDGMEVKDKFKSHAWFPCQDRLSTFKYLSCKFGVGEWWQVRIWILDNVCPIDHYTAKISHTKCDVKANKEKRI